MREESSSTPGIFFTAFFYIFIFIIYLLSPVSWIYYLWICFYFDTFGWLLVGLFIPPFGIIVGIWSLLFGAPGFIAS